MSADDQRFAPPQVDSEAQNIQPTDRPERISRTLSDREVALPETHLADTTASERAALLEPSLLEDFNRRWTDIQTGFVDEPRRAVEQADALVSDVIGRIADSFGRERNQLEQQWDRGGDVSTEDLRQALRRYRSFFSRLLTV